MMSMRAEASSFAGVPEQVTNRDGTVHKRCRVLVVDDHPVTRGGFARLFETLPGFNVCGEASSVTEAVRLCALAKPDLLVLDLSLGDEHGLEMLRRLTKVANGPRVLVASMLDELVYGRAALELGAHGFVSKSSGVEMIAAAAETLQQGGLAIPARLHAQMVGSHSAQDARRGRRRPSALSVAARNLLLALATADSLEELARERRVSIGTLHTQLYRVRKRLAMDSLAQLRTFASLYRTYLADRT
jgi:DNA-binding NarL/FixJ family response regulator